MEHPKGEGSPRLVDIRPQSVREHSQNALLNPISTKRKTSEKVEKHTHRHATLAANFFLEIPGLHRQPQDKIAQTVVRLS